MLYRNIRKERAFSLLEYLVLLLVVITTLVAFSGYMQHALHGQYRKTGETIGYLRQYSRTATVECAYDYDLNAWYAQSCFDNIVIVNGCKRAADFQACITNVKRSCTAGCRQTDP
ncbi:MAG: hypothetical protein WCI27_03445 [Candidatus Omnitrophota bacterium]